MEQRVQHWNSPIVVFSVVFCLVLATGTLVARELLANARTAPRNPAPRVLTDWRLLASVGHVAGNPAAPTTVVLFTDYQCPGCAELHRLLQLAADSMPALFRVVTRHFPLSNHAHAEIAANAAECAAAQQRFHEFERVAYSWQDSIGVVPWKAFAAKAGVSDTTEFNACVQQRRFGGAVTRDRAVAKQLNLAGTPAYIVNGTLRVGAPTFEVLMQQLTDGAANAR